MTENLAIPDGLDPAAVNLARAIRQQESGGDYNRSGDGGSSLGAYQWNNQPNGKSVPLQKGEIPSNFQAWAKEANLDPTDFSPKNQDMVAYAKIKKLKDEGHNVVDIAAIWNGGDPKRQDPNYVTPSGLPSQKKGVYDVPAYAKAVNDYYQELKAKTSTNESGKLTFDDISMTSPQKSDMQASPVSKIPVVGALGGGLGYAISNAMGTQDSLNDTQNQAITIQGNLLKQIQKDKAAAKDTTRLENALKELGGNIDTIGNQSSDTGTGGIKDKDVLKNAGTLAGIAAGAYAGGALGKAIKGAKATTALRSPAIKGILQNSIEDSSFENGLSQSLRGAKNVIPQTVESMSNGEKINALQNALTKANPAERTVIKKALDDATNLYFKEHGIAPTVVKANRGLIGKLLEIAGGVGIVEQLLGHKTAKAVDTAKGLFTTLTR